jgi:GxxExxY protein
MKSEEPKALNEISGMIIGAAMRVHSALGPGLFENVYEACLEHDLKRQGHSVRRQVTYPVVYDDLRIKRGFRVDLLVEDLVIVEVKAVAAVLPVHEAQLTSYLHLADRRLGLLINFHAPHLRDGIRRIVNKF